MNPESSATVDTDSDADDIASADSDDVAGDINDRYNVLKPTHKIYLSHSAAETSFVADLCADLVRRNQNPFLDRSRGSLAMVCRFPHYIFKAIEQCEVGVVILSEDFFTKSKWPMLELVAMVEESKKPNRKIKIIPVFYSISRDKCCDPNWMIEYWNKWKEEDKRRIDLGKWKSALGIFGSTTGLEMKDGMLDGELRAEIVEAICDDVLSEMRWDVSRVEGTTCLYQKIGKMVCKELQPKNLTGEVRKVGLNGMGGTGKPTSCNELSRDHCNVSNDLTPPLQSLDIAGDINERYHVLEAKHKIFLSHSGAQKSFVADLCADLMRRDRYPFFDRSRSSLPVGDKFPNLIFDAIGQCEVGVVVLSEEFFTRSKWPMLELVAMVEESKISNRRIKIIPIFYSISRDKCRDPTVQAKWMMECWKLWEDEDKCRIDLGKWKSALGILGLTTGLEVKDGMLDRELRAEIVEAICKDVLPEMRWDDSKVEGKTRLCQEICKKVYKGLQPKDLKGEVRMVGLYGMGGIGKTTACKMLCNELSRDYCDRVCHLEFGSMSELKLVRKVLKILTDLDVDKLDKISDVGVYHGYLKTLGITKERVFLALDNVSDDLKEQAKFFLEAKLGDGSMVLMTARSKDQLERLGVKRGDCFAMPELELEEAKCLFLSRTCIEKRIIDEVLLEKCVKRCYFHKGQSSSSGDGKHYHPLALKVLGSEVGDFIREHGVARQGALLTRINTFNLSRQKEHPVFSILRSSFDSLLEEDQHLFLHAALFLPDYPAGYRLLSCCRVLEWLGMVHGEKVNDIEWRLEGLKRKSLLQSSGKYGDDLSMHDLWREFAAAEIEGGKLKGRHLLYKGAECKRKVDLTGFPKMRVVRVMDVAEEVALDVRGLKQLKSLEVVVHGWRDSVLNGLGTLESLTYLSCDGVVSSVCIADLGSLTNLEVLELANFKGDQLPDMSKLTNLRKLNLDYSESLRRVSLQNLPNLTDLYVGGCTSLQSVDISGCRSMRVLWGLFHLIPALEELNVSSCTLLPSVIGLKDLTKLRKLDITGCIAIKDLNGLRRLVALEELRAIQCDSLTSLPSCKLPKLRVLDIEPSKVPAGFEWKIGAQLIRRFKERIANYRVRITLQLSHWWAGGG